MKRIFALFVAAIFVAAVADLAAAQGRGGANKPPKPSRPVTQSAKLTKSTKVTKPTKPTKTTKTTNVTKATKSPKATKPAKTSSTTTATTTNTTTNGTTTETTTPPAALPKNAKLVERLQKMLPDGTDMNDAASKFRNQGQFVAAVHASKNLDIPFEDLKTHMVEDGMSLGQAIKKLRPGVDAEQATATATTQASTDLGTTPAKNKRK